MEKMINQAAQNKFVSRHYDKSELWNKELYVNHTHFFNRLLIRRKEYTFMLLDKLMPGLSGAAIDLGCGPGAYLEEFKRRGFEVYGIDISQEMLNTSKARLNIDEWTFQKNFKCCDFEEIPYESNLFNAAACIGVLGLMLSDDKAVAEIYRILKPGGIFLLAVENMMSLSNIDFVIRQKIKSFLKNTSDRNNPLELSNPVYSGLTMSSSFFPSEHGLFYKIYNPNKLVRYMKDFGFYHVGSLTVGHEFRIIRRLNILPKATDTLEIELEKIFWKHYIPYFTNLGQFFIGAFVKK